MSFFSRLKAIFQAKANKALDAAENPNEMLDLSFEKQTELLTKVRRGVADVATSKKRLELQAEKLQASVGTLETQATAALQAGREDLARTALERKAGVQAQLESITTQKDQLQAEQDKLVAAEQKLTTKIESFRIRKETIKAQYTAAEAQTKIGEAFSGISEDMADVGMAMDRAENKVQTMQARAGAIDELLESGALDDLSVGGDVVDRELAAISSQSSVEADLARLKGQLGAGTPPAGEISGGHAVIVRVLGHGQYRLDDGDMAAVETADDAVEAAIAAGDESAFQAALGGLIDTITKVGDAVPDDEFVTSDVIVPDRDITLAEAGALESEPGEGLIPG